MRYFLFIFFLCARAHAIFLLNLVILGPTTTFSNPPLMTLIANETNATSITLAEAHTDTILGKVARELYFPNASDLYTFQAVHVTRLQYQIVSSDENQAKVVLRYRLSDSARSGLGFNVAIDSIVNQTTITASDFGIQIPPIVGLIAIAGWALTLCVLGIVVCINCCHTEQVVESGVVLTETKPTPPTIKPDDVVKRAPPPSKPNPIKPPKIHVPSQHPKPPKIRMPPRPVNGQCTIT